MTLYDLKPRFQTLLRPAVARLAQAGVSANQVTLAACALSLGVGAILCAWPEQRILFLLLSVWLALRMALNAADGMLAREFGQMSRLGAYLNELCDVIADAAMIAPFAFVAPFAPAWVATVIFLAALAEYAGAIGPLAASGRRYDGPFGKSDRALAFGALAVWVAVGSPLPDIAAWVMPLMAALLVATIANRVRRGLDPP